MTSAANTGFSLLRVCAVALLLPFAAACLFFLSLGMFGGTVAVREFVHTADTYRWRRVSGQVESNVVRAYMGSSRRSRRQVEMIEVHFRHELAGRGYSTNVWVRRSAQHPTLDHLRERYSVGSGVVCYVNPWAAHQAILQHSDLWIGAFAIPWLAFALVGGVGFVLFTRAIATAVGGEGKGASWPPPQPAARIAWYQDAWRPRLVFGWLLLAACAFLYPLALEPWFRVARARDWVATPCTVVVGRFDHRLEGDEPVTPGLSFAYTYSFAGQAHRGTRYSFAEVPFGSGPFSEAEAEKRPSGLPTVCFVNPHDPTNAVLRRGLTPDMAWGLVPLAAMGVAVLVWRRTHQA